MTDREMLEYAAKAAGYEPEDYVEIGIKKYLVVYNPETGTGGNIFDPRGDDGDAFRLAVKLNLSVKYDTLSDGSIVQVAAPWHESFSDNWWNEWLGDDSKNATRLAITRAAAEIGRSME